MRMERRGFIRAMAGVAISGPKRWSLLGEYRQLDSSAEGVQVSGKEIVIDARGFQRPVHPSPLHMGGTTPGGDVLRVTNLYLEREGKPCFPIAGEFHYTRFAAEGWADELRKIKAGGINTVSTYVFWILHETREGVFDWTGRRNLHAFVELCQKTGLEVILRIGPFAHGEMRNGGLPDWLYGKPFHVRSNDSGYIECVRRFYREIGVQAKGLLFQNGGPIVGIQLENEFMAATAPWGISEYREAPLDWIPSGIGGVEHMMKLKKIAIENGLNAPIFSCTAWGSPVPENEFLPMFGGYGFQPWAIDAQTHLQPPSASYLFRDSQGRLRANGRQGTGNEVEEIPFACCEMGGGMQCFYRARFVVPPESVQGIAITELGSGAAFLGYYMYHGGSNPTNGTVFYNEYDVPRISYDFQAPIREYGQVAPSYRFLRPIHLFLRDFGAQLAPMGTVLPSGAETIAPENTQEPRCAIRTRYSAGFLFLNNYQDHINMPNRTDLSVRIPLESGEIRIPESGGFGIASGEGAILPFNLELGGVRIRYATAQLAAQLEHERALHVFFFSPTGMRPEFCIAADSVDRCVVSGAAMQRTQQYIAVRGEEGKPLGIQCWHANRYVKIHLLSRADSLRMNKLTLWGRERLVLSDADCAEENGSLLAWRTGNPEIAVQIFPPPENAVKVHAETSGALDEFFLLRTLLPHWQGEVKIERQGEGIAQVWLSDHSFDGVDDLLLRIDYRGDIGNAFVNGVLVADNFSNGAAWEIGLKHLRATLRGQPLVIKIVPRLEGSDVVLDTTMARRERFEGTRIAVIDSIDAIPVYRSSITSRSAIT